MAMKTFSGIDEYPHEAAPRALVRRGAPVKGAPVVDDQDVAAAPLMDYWVAGAQSALDKVEGGATSLVNGFETTGIVTKKVAARGQERRIERPPAGADQDWRTFEKAKLV